MFHQTPPICRTTHKGGGPLAALDPALAMMAALTPAPRPAGAPVRLDALCWMHMAWLGFAHADYLDLLGFDGGPMRASARQCVEQARAIQGFRRPRVSAVIETSAFRNRLYTDGIRAGSRKPTRDDRVRAEAQKWGFA